MAYLYLALAIVFEVVATSALPQTQEFSRFWVTCLVLFAYGLAFYFLTLAIKTIPVGIAYGIWGGVGICLVVLIAMVVYRQVPDMWAILGILLIISGVLVIQLLSNMKAH